MAADAVEREGFVDVRCAAAAHRGETAPVIAVMAREGWHERGARWYVRTLSRPGRWGPDDPHRTWHPHSVGVMARARLAACHVEPDGRLREVPPPSTCAGRLKMGTITCRLCGARPRLGVRHYAKLAEAAWTSREGEVYV